SSWIRSPMCALRLSIGTSRTSRSSGGNSRRSSTRRTAATQRAGRAQRMKATERHQVRKRDGRVERLRASKLAFSIHRAIVSARGGSCGAGNTVNTGNDASNSDDPCDPHGEEWRPLALTSAVLTGLRLHLRGPRMLSTARLSEAVERVLFATGFPAAAAAYGAARGAQTRRRGLLRAALSLPPVRPADAMLADRSRGRRFDPSPQRPRPAAD